MKLRSTILLIVLTIATSINCLGFQTKAEFRTLLKEKVYGDLDHRNKNDDIIKREVVPHVFKLIDDERDALKKERDDLKTKVRILDTGTPLLPVPPPPPSPSPPEPPSIVRPWIVAVALGVGLFLGRVYPRGVSLIRKTISRKPKPAKNKLPINSNKTPNKCPQCGAIRAEGRDKCPNPKCAIRF